MKTATTFETRFDTHTAGLEFLSVGGCPGCAECGLEMQWRIDGVPSAIFMKREFGDEEEAILEMEAFLAEPENVALLEGHGGSPDKVRVEESEPSQREMDIASEGHFSWGACDTCGSSLGGNRYAAHARMDGRLVHLDVCEDCLAYIANGELPA